MAVLDLCLYTGIQKPDLREFHPHPGLRKHKRTLALKLHGCISLRFVFAKGLSLLIGSTLSWRLKLRFSVITWLQEHYQPVFLQGLFTLVLQHSAIRRWLLETDLLCIAFAHLISRVKTHTGEVLTAARRKSVPQSPWRRGTVRARLCLDLGLGLVPSQGQTRHLLTLSLSLRALRSLTQYCISWSKRICKLLHPMWKIQNSLSLSPPPSPSPWQPEFLLKIGNKHAVALPSAVEDAARLGIQLACSHKQDHTCTVCWEWHHSWVTFVTMLCTLLWGNKNMISC